MSIIEIYYKAKCKHCKHLFSYRKGKLKRHSCGNFNSEFHEQERTLKDKICDKFEL